MVLHSKHFFFLIVFFAITQPLFSQITQSQEKKLSPSDSTLALNFYSQALQEISQQDFQSAENSLIRTLEINPDFDDARFALIRIYFSQKELNKAESIAKKGTALSPNNAILWEALADIYKETKNYKAIIPVFDRLIRINPDQIKNYLDKAYTYTLMKDYKQSIDFYNKIQAKFGGEESVYSGRIGAYLKQGKTKQAIKEANDYIHKNKNDSRAYLMLANLYLDLKDPNEALKVLNEAENKFPDAPSIYLTKADTYQQLKDDNELLIQLKKAFASKNLELDNKIKILFNLFQEFQPEKAVVIADALCQILVETHPNEPNALAVYGDILLQQNKSQEALIKFKEALNLNPRMDIIWENVLQIEVAAGNYSDAQKDGEQALNYSPQSPVLLLFTGYAFLFDKKYEKARPFLEGALNSADPKNSTLLLQIYSSLGDLYNSLNLPEVSNVAYEEALAIDSNNTYVLNNYAYYLSVRKENLEKAALYSKRSNELQPGNASFEDTYAWVLFQQENYQEALVWIEKALKSSLEPSSTLLEHYGDILSKLGKEKEAVLNWENALKISLANGQNSDLLKNKIKNRKYVQ
jgi:tetratricopeptide (TPR) repeat protein